MTSEELREHEQVIAQHIKAAAPDGCVCEPCEAARTAGSAHLDVLRQCSAALQDLDLESDYYINGTQHPYQKQRLQQCLDSIAGILFPSAEKGEGR